MTRVTPILTMILACGLATPAFAGSMSMDEIKARLEAQTSGKKIEPASVRTDEEGNPLSTSGYMAMPASLSIMLDLQFRPGRSSISKAGGKQVKALCEAMKSMDNMPSIQLIGHSDSGGKAESNHRVSQERADATRAYIATECGIPDGLMLTSSEGEAYASSKVRAEDRRIEVQLIGAPAPEPMPAEEMKAEDKPADNG